MMKTFILGLLISLSVAAIPLPENPCDLPGETCSEWMHSIHNDFKNGSRVTATHVPQVYAGECRYHSTMYSGDWTHYVGMYLERDVAGGIYFNASFSFFADENEYLNWTLAEARSIYPNPYNFILTHYENQSIADYWPEGLWKHWLSWHEERQEMLIVGYWGFETRAFCRLKPLSSNHQTPAQVQ